MRSTNWMTRSRRCSAMMTVTLKSCTKRWRTDRTSSAAMGSSALVGSSRTNTFGCITSAAAIATRCCSPPLSELIARLRTAFKLSRSKTSSTRLRITSGAKFNASIPNAISSSTISVTKPLIGFWPTMPTRWANEPGFTSRVEIPSTVMSPARIPPV